MSDTVLVTPHAFRLVLRNPAHATVSQADHPQSEIVRLRERCAVLTEAERSLKAALAGEQARLKALTKSFDRAWDDFANATEQTARQELTALSLRLAEVILRRELPDRDMIREVIRLTLAPLSDRSGVRVRMHPADAKALARDQAEGAGPDLAGRIEIVADPALTPGDVVLETRGGYFDARISERLKLMEAQLMERAGDQRRATQDGPGGGAKPGA